MAGSRDGRGRHGGEQHRRRGVMLHPARQWIGRLLVDGREAGAAELAAELEAPPAGIAYHLRVLFGAGVLKAVPPGRPAAPVYRWSPDADWARKLLDKGNA